MPLEALPSGSLSSADTRRVPAAMPKQVAAPHRRKSRREVMLIPVLFLAAFLGNARVILLQEVIVLGHELLAGILIHLLAQSLGEMTPDVLVEIGDLAHVPLRAVAAARGAGLLQVLRLRIGVLTPGRLAALALPVGAGLQAPLETLLSTGRTAALRLTLLLTLLLVLLALLLVLLLLLLLALLLLHEILQIFHDVALDLLRSIAQIVLCQALLSVVHVLPHTAQ